MAMTDDSDFPRLTPPDDRFPAHDGLHRKPEELTDEQFDLLAAAWSEEALTGDQLSELEEAMTAIPSRRMRAESFRGVKLVPYEDKWDGRNMLLRQAPATRVIKRTIVISLLAAAAVVLFIITGPAIRSLTRDITPGALPDGAAMSEALIHEAYPVIIPDRVKEEPGGVNRVIEPERPAAVTNVAETERPAVFRNAEMTDPGKAVPATESAEQTRALPVNLAINAANPVMIAAARTTDLRAVEMNPATNKPQQAAVSAEMPAAGKESNWIFRGVSTLAKAITKEEKKIDGYFVASACVKGINNALGWEMELEQASNKAGKPVALNFSSSLLTFSSPVNKNSP